jgi:GNAT superfamily N-acetyltransferase
MNPQIVPEPAPLSTADLEAAQRLVAAAGWNQTLSDWQMFLEDGRIFGCKDESGRVVATAATMPYRQVGWISLMLVDEAWRRRGLATRLMTACIEELEGAGLVPALDATPMGREVYAQMGFRDVLPLTRWLAERPRIEKNATSRVRACDPHDLARIVALDLPGFAGGRARLFERLLQRSQSFACVSEWDDGLSACLLGREGRSAAHLGPVFAPDLETAAELVEFALARIPGPAIIDAPDARDGWADWLVAHGFVRQRPIMRMVRGEQAVELGSDRLFAVAGPDLG